MLEHKRVGLLGGGQLGRMLLQQAANFPGRFSFLDPSHNASAAPVARDFVVGKFEDFEDVLAFGSNQDALTIEIEGVNTQALTLLQDKGKLVVPDPQTIAKIKNKLTQKQFYADRGFPTATFLPVYKESFSVHPLDVTGFFKYAEGGFDGRGVVRINDRLDWKSLTPSDGYLEEAVDYQAELSVLVARDGNGQIQCYEPVEQVMDKHTNQLDYLVSPARIPAQVSKQAKELASDVAIAFNLVGLLAVELFLTHDNRILVNEVAPRPHNSGHHTIESYNSSQFDQLIRVLLGLPLAPLEMRSFAGILNLVGDPLTGEVAELKFIDKIVANKNAYFHWYGKSPSKPNRKMGHITVIGRNHIEVEQTIAYIKGLNR